MKRTLFMTITLSVALATGFTFSSPANARTSLADLQAAIEALVVCPATAPTRFVDNGDGTICDRDTGLRWETKDATADSVKDFTNPRDVDNQYTWTDTADGDFTNPDGTAFTDFLAKLNGVVADTSSSEQLAGYNDWRLPTSAELQTILDCSFGIPCIDPIFGPTVAGFYWSSTSFANGPDNAWFVKFSSDFVDVGDKIDDFPVRAVRGGR